MILEINGQEVEVDDGFDKLTPEQQNATVDEIAKSLAPARQSETQLGADRRMVNDAQVAEQTAIGRQEAYDQKPWYSQALQAGQDVGRLLENGATMGFGDKVRAVSSPSTEDGALAKLNASLNYINPVNALGSAIAGTITGGSDTYKENLAKERDTTQAARDRARSAALPAEIAGAVMSGSTAANAGLTMAGRFNTANAPGVMASLTRAGLVVPEGATYGAIDALGNDRDVKTGALTGALAAPVASLAGDAISKVAAKVLPAKTASTVPSLDKLKKSASDAYDDADKAGLIVNDAAIKRLKANVEQELLNFGYHPSNQPGIKAALDDLDRISQGNVTLKGLDVTRRIAKNAYSPMNPSQSEASRIVTSQIDNFISNLNAKDVLAGDKVKGLTALEKGRKLWTQVRKNEDFIDAVESASLRAASTGSGGNVENATRQNLRRMIDPASKTARRNWTADEAKAIEEIVRGTPTQNALRLAGKLSPQGNGLMAALGVGGAMTNPILGVPALGGLAAKHMADRGVMRGVEALDELIRAGGSKAQLQAAQATLRQLTQAQREAVARIVQMSIIQSEVGQQEPAQ